MDFRNLPLVGGRIVLFVAQILTLILSLLYIQVIYKNDILPDKLVKETFTQTSCTILSKQITQKGHIIHLYRANFLISYVANKVPFQVWVSGNGLDYNYLPDRKLQERTLAAYELGNTYPCWYSPQNPRIAVLVIQHTWLSTLPLIIPSTIAIIAAFFMLKTLFQFFGFISLTSQEKKKRFKQ